MTLQTVIGEWGVPPDLPAKLAIALAAVTIGFAFVKRSPLLFEGTERRFLAVASVAAGVLSIAYVSSYLHGGPRIIDATTYFLQGRALSHGAFAWHPLEPSANFRGRFLLYDEHGATLGGIFPPGYPLLLAVGFLLGAPMVVGPAIAVGIVVATYRLARALDLAAPYARAAALLSVVCAALRYHTADTMSHGATALGIALALTCALEGRALLAWLAVGYVVATRPVSAIPVAIVVAVLSRRSLARVVGIVPGVALLLYSQHAVTGEWLSSTQRLYYAISDGPPGCFAYGFGANVGCVFEHGDFVAARLPHGYGLVEALGTTIRRLHHHLLDVASFEPLALLVVVPIVRRWRDPKVRAASAVVGLHFLAYLPFYFDGDYPGGGARLFADVLPIEHVLVVLGVVLLARQIERTLHLLLGVSLAGFAVHAAFEHDRLRDRDGGHPFWETDELAHASIKQGLVFIDTDHGFNLGHDPFMKIEDGILVVRRRGDDRDRLLYENLNRPMTYWYRFDPANGIKQPIVVPWAPPPLGEKLRFEGEAEWPALRTTNALAAPGWTFECASGKRALVVTPIDGDHGGSVDIELPVPADGDYELTVAVAHAELPNFKTKSGVLSSKPHGELHVLTDMGHPGEPHVEWSDPTDCASLVPIKVRGQRPKMKLQIWAEGGPVSVDALYLRSLGSH